MATLDDIPILPPTTPTTDDLIAVIDGADRRSPKQVTLAQLGALVGGTPTAASIAAALTTDDTVHVIQGESDTERAANLLTAYAAAKLLTPNGAALSTTNRARVMIPPGGYKLTSTLNLDTSFVDLVATVPQKGGDIQSGDDLPYFDAMLDSTYRPSPTVIYTNDNDKHLATQTAGDIKLIGLTFALLQSSQPPFNAYHALYLDCDNSASFYDRMYFYNRWTDILSTPPASTVAASSGIGGYWEDCIGPGSGWRLGDNGVFTAHMVNCQAGPYGFAGDAAGGSFGACRLERCKCIGTLGGAGDGTGGFGGCGTFGVPSISTSIFIECEAGTNSFCIGKDCGGTFIRCRGGDRCFGGTSNSTDPATFSGYAEDCFAGAQSFGGTQSAGFGKCTGTLVRCTSIGNTASTRLEGAKIRDSRFTFTTNNVHGFTLLNSNSRITNTDVIVAQGGTGVPIYAASALNVVAAHCRFNNASTDADGLHANVTNLIATPYNVIDNDIA